MSGISQSYALVIACPTLTMSASLADGTVGAAYSQTLTTTPTGGNYSYRILNGTFPPGLTLAAATGVVSGSSTQSGTFTFTLEATGFGSCTTQKIYTLTMACPTGVTVTPSLPGGTLGVAYNQTIAVQTPPGTYSFTLNGGTLPIGLTLASDGQVSGTPTQAGNFAFSVRITGANICPVTQTYSIAIACPTVTLAPSLPNGQAGVAYSQAVGQLGGTLPLSYSAQVVNGALLPCCAF